MDSIAEPLYLLVSELFELKVCYLEITGSDGNHRGCSLGFADKSWHLYSSRTALPSIGMQSEGPIS